MLVLLEEILNKEINDLNSNIAIGPNSMSGMKAKKQQSPQEKDP